MTETFIVIGDENVKQVLGNLKQFFGGRKFRQLLEDTKNLLVALSKQAAPRRTSLLYSRIGGAVRIEGDEAVVEYGVNVGTQATDSKLSTYARAQEYGAKSHPIFPNRARALVWYTRGGPRGEKVMVPGNNIVPPPGLYKHVRRSVFHPGNPERPYLRPQLAVVRPRFISALTRLLDEAAKGSK